MTDPIAELLAKLQQFSAEWRAHCDEFGYTGSAAEDILAELEAVLAALVPSSPPAARELTWVVGARTCPHCGTSPDRILPPILDSPDETFECKDCGKGFYIAWSAAGPRVPSSPPEYQPAVEWEKFFGGICVGGPDVAPREKAMAFLRIWAHSYLLNGVTWDIPQTMGKALNQAIRLLEVPSSPPEQEEKKGDTRVDTMGDSTDSPTASTVAPLSDDDKETALAWAESAGMRIVAAAHSALKADVRERYLQRAKRDVAIAREILRLPVASEIETPTEQP